MAFDELILGSATSLQDLSNDSGFLNGGLELKELTKLVCTSNSTELSKSKNLVSRSILLTLLDNSRNFSPQNANGYFARYDINPKVKSFKVTAKFNGSQRNRLQIFVEYKDENVIQAESEKIQLLVLKMYLGESSVIKYMIENDKDAVEFHQIEAKLDNALKEYSKLTTETLEKLLTAIEFPSRFFVFSFGYFQNEGDYKFRALSKANFESTRLINQKLIAICLNLNSNDEHSFLVAILKKYSTEFNEIAYNSETAEVSSTGNNSKVKTTSRSQPNFKIFYGPPGTGKTREARNLTQGSVNNFKIIQIHPSSSYEDLIEGIKPVTFASGDVKYEVQDGPIKIMSKKSDNLWVKSLVNIRKFKEVDYNFILLNFPIGTLSKWFSNGESFSCRILIGDKYYAVFENQQAKSDTIKIDLTNEDEKLIWNRVGMTKKFSDGIEETYAQIEFKGNLWGNGDYVLVLDELNRGNVSSILGELIFAISEARGTHTDKKAVTLQYSHEEFLWPSNLSLYGTMNSTDVSLDRIDQAIKRRFDFKVVMPNSDLLKIDTIEENGLDKYLTELNKQVMAHGEESGAYNVKDKLIGHASFLQLKELISHRKTDGTFKIFVGTELKKLWDSQIYQSLLSIFNGSREDLDKFIDSKLKKVAPSTVEKLIFGWPYKDPINEENIGKAS